MSQTAMPRIEVTSTTFLPSCDTTARATKHERRRVAPTMTEARLGSRLTPTLLKIGTQ